MTSMVERVARAIYAASYKSLTGRDHDPDDHSWAGYSEEAQAAIAEVFDWLAERKLDGTHDPYWASEYWQGQFADMRKEALGND